MFLGHLQRDTLYTCRRNTYTVGDTKMAGFFSKGDKQNQWIAKAEQAYEKGFFEDAADLFSKAAEAEPNNANLWIKLAASQKYNGKYEAAVRSYTKAVEANPEASHAWIQLALLLGDSGKCEEALSALSHVSVPESEIYLRDRKCEWLERVGKYAEASAAALSLCSSVPTSKAYRIRAADLLLRAGKYSEAREIYDELSRSFDENASEYTASAALCCELAGDASGALFRYKNAGEEDFLSWYRRARLEEAAGEFKEAAASYAKVQQGVAADDISVSFRRALSLFFSGSGKEAAAQLEKIISRQNSSADLWYLLGAVSFMNGSLKRAVEAFDTVIRIGSPAPSIWYMKGAAEFLSGKYKEAVESFEKTSRMTGGSSVTRSSMFDEGDILFDSREKEPAKVEFGTVNVGLLSMQAVSLAALGRYAEADKAARIVLDSAPDRYDMELLRLRCLAGQGKYRQASDAFSRVSSRMPEDYLLLFEHAELLMLAGDYGKAAETWEHLLSFCPGNTLVYSRLVQSAVSDGNFADAKRVADLLLTDSGEDLFSLLAAGDASYADGSYADAEQYYAKACEIQAENPAALVGLGRSRSLQGKFAEAKAAFSSAAEITGGAPGIRILEAKAAAEAGEFDEAISLYMDVINANPEIRGVSGEVARLAFSLGRFADAADAVSYAVSQNDAGYALLRLGGDACMRVDRIDEAVSYYTQALELEPESIPAAASLAHAELFLGEYQKALANLKRVCSADAKPESYYDKALCEINLGKLDDAEESLRILCDLDAENQAALLLLADVFERKGDFDSMLDVYGQYLELNTENMEVFRKASAVYRMRGETEAALNGYEMILERNPKDRLTLRFKAEALFACGEFAEAAEVCAVLLEDEDDSSIKTLYAEALANAGDAESALQVYEALVKDGLSNADAFLMYADLLSRNSEYAKAEKVYARLVQAFPKNERAFLERAANAVKIGDQAALLSALRDAAAVNPKNPYVLAGVAYLYAASGHPNEALSFFDKAESAGCRDADVYCSRAVIYLSQSRFDLADKAASEAVRRRPANRTALRLKAKALEGLGQLEEAVSYYNRMLEADEFDEEEDIPLPAVEERKPEPKKTYSEESYGERREKSGYRDMIIN